MSSSHTNLPILRCVRRIPSKPLVALLQASGRERLAAAQMGTSPEAMKEAVAFARAVLVPKVCLLPHFLPPPFSPRFLPAYFPLPLLFSKSESGAARHYFTASQRLMEDKKKHPWRYGEDGHGE